MGSGQLPNQSAMQSSASITSDAQQQLFGLPDPLKSGSTYVNNHQIFKQSSGNGGAPSAKMVAPRRQNVSAGGVGMGPLGSHNGSFGL